MSNCRSYNVWLPTPQNEDTSKNDFPYIYMQQPSSGTQAPPRLIHVKQFFGKSGPTVSTKGSANYHNEETAVWKIYPANWDKKKKKD